MEPGELLVLAMQLAVLSYYIGVLIYMLPIPSRRLKRLGPLLIEDSIQSAILISILNVVAWLSEWVSSLSGLTLEDTVSYIRESMSTAILINYFARMLSAGAGLFSGSLAGIVTLFFLPFSLTFYSIVTASALAIMLLSIVGYAKSILLALGALLYSIPLRIGRNVGASLVAFIIAANAMLPFLPKWTAFVMESTLQGYGSSLRYPPQGLYNIWGKVSDSYGGTIRIGLIRFVSDNGDVYQYIIHEDSSFYVNSPTKYLPAGRYRLAVETMGLVFDAGTVIVPDDLVPHDLYSDAPYFLQVALKNPNVAFMGYSVVLFNGCKYVEGEEDPVLRQANVTLACDQHSAVNILTLSDCTVTISGDKVQITSKDFYSWRGSTVTATVIEAEGRTTLSTKCPKIINKPILIESYYFNATTSELQASIVDPFITQLILGIAYSAAIYSYLAMLSATSVGLAKLLGAPQPRIIFRGR
jgi:hypothetical protein